MQSLLSRRAILKGIAGSAASGYPAARVARSRARQQPDILFILADDLRFDALGYANPTIRTPNIDLLAKEGLRFRNAFVTSAICSISRASIFTGTYARRHKICDFGTPLSPAQLASSYPAVLKRAGYRTALFGKYGVGDIKDETGQWIDAQLPEHVKGDFDVIEDYGFSYFPREKGGVKQHIHDVLAAKAEEFIRSTPRGQPLCLSLNFVSPHFSMRSREGSVLPAEPDILSTYGDVVYDGRMMSRDAFESLPPYIQESIARRGWHGMFEDPEKRNDFVRRYYSLITGLDRAVGRVVDALRSAGRADNTAIVFASDNGEFLGDFQLMGKYFGYEPAIRIPLLIRPAGIPVSKDIQDVALNIDIAPTICSIAQVPIPRTMQGQDLTPLWSSSRAPKWRKDFLYELVLCRSIWLKSEDVEEAIPRSEGVRDERYTYLRFPLQRNENELLFDRWADPKQMNNMIASARTDLVNRLRHRTDELIAAAS